LGIEAFRISTPTTGQIVLLIILALVVVLAFVIASRRTSAGKRTKIRTAGTGWNNFYQLAKLRNLSKNETEILKRLVVNYGLTKPALIFTSTNILDGCIQRAIRRISIQEIKGESKDDIINMYYKLRNKIVRSKGLRGISTTRDIQVGTKLRVQVLNYGNYWTSVNKNEPDYIGIIIPVMSPGKSVPWNRKKVRCSFWKEGDAVYEFETRVSDVLIDDETQSICLKHTDRIKRIQKRLYPRKNVRLPVLFSRLRVIEEGGKKKAVVERKDSHWGTIVDISVGGMSIETIIPFDKDNYLRMEFEIRENYKVVAVGKVRRIERNPAQKNWIMHIQFTKIDKRHRNEIFAILYNYQTI